MSSTNYDVELNITYDNAYRHYIPSYTVSVPAYYHKNVNTVYNSFHYYVSLDNEAEVELGYSAGPNVSPSYPFWAVNCPLKSWWNPSTAQMTYPPMYTIPYSGVYSKMYIRNIHRELVTYTPSNCAVRVMYNTKASFEVQWNSTGFAANQNASFRCSTIPKNTYKQYEWTSATVYYKKSTDPSYSSAVGTVSGSWSDVLINTNLAFEDNYTYDVYITATSDDGTTASTSVAQFTTTDADAIATCISPSGAFTQGDVTFVWSHRTEYGTPQYAYDLQYSVNNGSSWTTLASHVVTSNTTTSTTLSNAGVYLWRVRTYNSNDVVGEWAEATFVNQVPASPPTNLQITTAGRPTVSWASVSQSAYQVQFLLGDSVAYDSGAVYTSETSHFVNRYFDDTRSYIVRVRVYNALGEVSDWIQVGYQQPSVSDVDFAIDINEGGGVTITITPNEDYVKYYILRNNKLIAEATDYTYTDLYAVGLTNYSVVGVTSSDQSDIQTKGIKVVYPHPTIIAQNGQQFLVNKRVDTAYDISTNNQADINKANFLGDSSPTHYPSAMRLKTFNISCFDDQGIAEGLLGSLVFYADNFANGGWCIVTAYDKRDNFVKNGQGIYGNEVSLTLEVTNYDDSIEYPI